MGRLPFPSGIQLNLATPLDSRFVVANQAARESLSYVYEGLQVFELDTKKLYLAYQPANSTGFSWKEITTSDYNTLVVSGYYLNGEFYSSSTYLEEVKLAHNTNWIYCDKNHNNINVYIWNAIKDSETGTTGNYHYIQLNDQILADSQNAGVMKLYSESGQNTDGTMTQKSITDGVNSITFAVDPNDSECLILDLPWD